MHKNINIKSGIGNQKIESTYKAVTTQAGIYAGKDGYDINVKNKTKLTGSTIQSKVNKDKNNLVTGTLEYKHIQNKAEYKTDGQGININTDKKGKLNEKGITPQINPALNKKETNETKTTIQNANIQIQDKENQKQDIQEIQTNVETKLETLKEIYNKAEIEEQKEMIKTLQEIGNKTIHKIAQKNGWKEGSKEKLLMHTALGAIEGKLTGNTATGAIAGSLNEAIISKIEKEKGKQWIKDHPDTLQWISHLIGETIDQITKNNTGKQTAVAGTKWNRLAYENFTINEVKEIMKKKDGKQMTGKEIAYLLKDIINKAKEKDPSADKSQYWELGNKEAVQAINETLKEHNISEKNIIEFMKTSKNKVIELIQEDLKLEEEYKLKLAKYKKDGTSTLPMVYVYGIRIRSPKLEEECEHSDLYEAEKDLKRNLEKTLSENMKNRFINLAVKENKASMVPVSSDTAWFLAQYSLDELKTVTFAYDLLRHGLAGKGQSQTFYKGSTLTNDIEDSDELTYKVKELAKNINNGEKKAYYSSLDYNRSGNLNRKLAYGKVKLAIEISKDNNGNISYKGIVGDTYNFEYNFDLAYYYNKIFKSNLNNTEKNESGILSHIGTEFLNNGAYFVQKYGSLIPYNWTAEIGGKL